MKFENTTLSSVYFRGENIPAADIPILLITLTAAGFNGGLPWRIVADAADVTGGAGGNVYTSFAFEVGVPGDRDREEPSVQLRLGNTDRALMPTLMAGTASDATLLLELVRRDAPAVVEWSTLFGVDGVVASNEDLIFSLSHGVYLDTALCRVLITPENRPGLFPHQ